MRLWVLECEMKNYVIVRYGRDDYAVTLDHVIIAEVNSRKECEDVIRTSRAIDEDDFLTLMRSRG